MKILVDDREVSKELFEAFDYYSHKENFEWQKQRLIVGDFLYNDVVIERKEASDFISSIIDGRLKEQAAKMCLNYKNKYLILEGNPFNTESEINPHAIIGKMTSLLIKDGISILPVSNAHQCAYAVFSICKKHSEAPNSDIDTYRVLHALRQHEPLVAMLCQVPGLGLDKANTISGHYNGSIKNLLANANIASLTSIEGIGPKTAASIIKFMQ
jgi:ERCC4-type nuclease